MCDFIRLKAGSITVYEAGTGTGFSCRKFLEYPNVTVKGCDVVLSDRVKNLIRENTARISIDEDTLYNSLNRTADNSIDIFYADNVFEHLFPDEFPEIMKLLVKKLRQDALIFLFIPNSIIGPSDISGEFLKTGSKAQGFHFMEMTYGEMLEQCAQYGIVPAYLVYKTLRKQYRYIKDSSGKLNRIKVMFENIIKHLPPVLVKKSRILGLLGMGTYILRKQ